MTLREQIARKCAANFIPRLDDREPFDTLTRFNRDRFLKFADEVIRQMEWARHECPFEWAGTPDPITKAGSPDAVLTMAPDDWNP